MPAEFCADYGDISEHPSLQERPLLTILDSNRQKDHEDYRRAVIQRSSPFAEDYSNM